jgi:hypothetical protein
MSLKIGAVQKTITECQCISDGYCTCLNNLSYPLCFLSVSPISYRHGNTEYTEFLICLRPDDLTAKTQGTQSIFPQRSSRLGGLFISRSKLFRVFRLLVAIM